MPRDRRDKHLSHETLLDLLEDRLDAAGRNAAESHLGRPCRTCRERVRVMGALLERLSGGALEPVPAPLRRIALAAFGAHAPEPAPATGLAQLLELVFDSQRQPLGAAARRTVGEARLLRFAQSGVSIEVECEPESADQVSLRGRLLAPDPSLHRIEAHAGREHLECWADNEGAFRFEGLPRGEIRLFVTGPSGRLEAPAFSA